MEQRQWEQSHRGRAPFPRVVGRRFAVGDVHGCSRTLRTLVEEVLHLHRQDVLFLLGDYLDRGPDSKGVLDYLMALREAGYDLRPLMGNHEEMALAAVADPEARRLWYFNSGSRTVAQFGVDKPERIPSRYLGFLVELPRILLTPGYVLVHAALDFSRNDPIRETSPSFMLWERSSPVDAAKIGGRTLLCGHTMTSLDSIVASLDGKSICLDNGCWAKGEPGYGNLVALQLDTRQLLVQENCE